MGEENLKLLEPETRSLLATLNDFLTKKGIKSYLVGGFVRDVLLGRDTADIDIALAADAVEVAPQIADALGGGFVPLDEINKVGRVVATGKNAPSGGRWQIDFSALQGTIEQDLGKRDFTIDAMAVDLGELAKGSAPLTDPFDGRGDLKNRVIRAVSEAAFPSDPARLLRAVRLAAELGFTIESQTEALVKRHYQLIGGVAGERIREELLRLLAADSGRFLPYLDELGLLTALFPEMAAAKGVGQPREHHWDVFAHSLKTVMAVDFLLHQGSWEHADAEVLAAAPWSDVLAQHFAQPVSSGSTRRSLLKLAALLHDVAKPQTKAVGEDGRTHFLGHAKLGAAIAVDRLEKLRFSGKEVKLVEIMIRYHLRPGQMSQEELPTNRAIYRYFRDCGEAGTDILYLSLADHLATRGPNLSLAGWQEHTGLVDYVLAQHAEQEKLVVPAKLVSGHDLINIFGLKPGPGMGEILEAVREAQASGEVATREEALAFVRERLETEAVNNYG